MKKSASTEHHVEKPGLPGSPIADLVDRYRELLDIQEEIATGAVARAPVLTQAQARDRLAAGVPLLSFDDFFPGWEAAEPAFRRVSRWAAGGKAGLKQGDRWASEGMGPGMFRELAKAWYDGGTPPSPGDPRASAELFAMVGACLRPFLLAQSRLLMPMVEQSHWRRRRCPVCGGIPDLSYLAKDDGARCLICSRCGSAWLFQRLECPCCGTQDPAKLAYLTDDTERYRLYICDACRTYIKAVDLRRAKPDARLPLERFLTLHLDQQAGLDGYRPVA